jgi:hypothetical protein
VIERSLNGNGKEAAMDLPEYLWRSQSMKLSTSDTEIPRRYTQSQKL